MIMHFFLARRGSRAFSLIASCRDAHTHGSPAGLQTLCLPLFAAKCRSQELLKGVHSQGTRKREFQGACLTYFTVNMETHAIHSHSAAPYINPGMGPDVNTQPAGLENIRPLSCPLETWMGDTSPLKRPSITPFINLLPRSQRLAAWEVVLMLHFCQQLGGLQRVSSTPRG